jgi:hypothetical protein
MSQMLDMMSMMESPMMYRKPSMVDEAFGWDIHPKDLNAIMMAPKQMRRQLSSISREKELMIPTMGKDGFQVIMSLFLTNFYNFNF